MTPDELVQQIAEAIEPIVTDSTDSGDLAHVIVSLAALVEAQVAPLRDEVEAFGGFVQCPCDKGHEVMVDDGEGGIYRCLACRADAAESALRQVREDLTTLADEWEQPLAGARQRYNGSDEFHEIIEEEKHRKKHAAEVRAILDSARVGAARPCGHERREDCDSDCGAADSQPEGAGGVALIAAERRRQIEAEGYTAEHDANHGAEVLAKAAATYADKASQPDEWVGKPFPRLDRWPWRDEDFKPQDRRTALVKAGALIAAALDAEPCEHTSHYVREDDGRQHWRCLRCGLVTENSLTPTDRGE